VPKRTELIDHISFSCDCHVGLNSSLIPAGDQAEEWQFLVPFRSSVEIPVEVISMSYGGASTAIRAIRIDDTA